jgi:hypothetical protein
MAQQQAAAQVARLLGTVGRWGVVVGLGGTAAQAALYTGDICLHSYRVHLANSVHNHNTINIGFKTLYMQAPLPVSGAYSVHNHVLHTCVLGCLSTNHSVHSTAR